MTAGLAGGLEPPDIPRLLLAAPDVLGFRGALCAGRERAGALAPAAVALVRDLIPRERRDHAGAPNIDWRLIGRGLAGAEEAEGDLDRIFVRDFVIEAEIGAYDFERGRKQRVAFDVEAWIGRAGGEPRDMRAIFSYDVILDAIRIVAASGHHEFVEGLRRGGGGDGAAPRAGARGQDRGAQARRDRRRGRRRDRAPPRRRASNLAAPTSQRASR